MLHEEPYTSIVVSDIVQWFICDISIPTIECFNRCARLLWNMPPYSGPIPAPYPLQTTSPMALPPGSSVFIYYGKQYQAAVVNSDSDDDNKTHQSLIGSLSHSCPITSASPHTVSRTPERTLSYQSSKTLTTNSFISPMRSPSCHNLKSGPSHLLSFCGAGSSQVLQLPVTPTRARAENQYADFIDTNGLTDFHPAIDLVHQRVVMFWKDELLNLSINQDLVADLMSVMNSYSETEHTFPSPFR